MSNRECSFQNFISDSYSICREERQYAVFLYNILKYYNTSDKRNNKTTVNKIFKACNLDKDVTIENVFYEATFMRDFFERNRRLVLGEKCGKDIDSLLLQKTFSPSLCKIEDPDKSFNFSLIQYVHKKIASNEDIGCEFHLGNSELDCDILNDEEKYIIRCMMNAKPDLAVIYKQAGTKFLLFLECKFESSEDFYKNGHTYTSQREIQWKIADFLCNHYLKDKNIQVDNKMEKSKKSCLVQFARKSDKPEVILIEDLISLNNDIFK